MVSELSAPFDVSLSVTRRCNLCCRHCSANSGPERNDELRTGEIVSLLGDLAEMKVFRITLTGGEIFLRQDGMDLVEIALQYPFTVQVNTNATLVTAERAARLRRLMSRRRFRVLVGLDGATAATHDRLRGEGAFDRTVTGIRELGRQELPFTVFCVVTRYNKGELDEIVALVSQLGARKINLSLTVPTGRARCYERELCLTRDEIDDLAVRYRSLQEKYQGRVGGAFVSILAGRGTQREAEKGTATSRAGRLESCGAAAMTCAITATGDVAPCEMAGALVAGNIREKSFCEIYRFSSLFTRLRGMRGMTLDEVHLCKDCRWRHGCHGTCLALGYGEYGIWPSGSKTCFEAEKTTAGS